jgi:predicted transcriptional regulator
MLSIAKTLSTRKKELLNYFRERSAESLEELRQLYGSNDYKRLASEINTAITS